MMIYSQMSGDKKKLIEISKDSDLYFFNEEKYIQNNPDAYDEERI